MSTIRPTLPALPVEVVGEQQLDDLTVTGCEYRPWLGGTQLLVDFPNGYSASVVRNPFSYGYEAGLFEVAVLKGDRIVYDTPVTDDVIGYLDPSGVAELLRQIAGLPRG